MTGDKKEPESVMKIQFYEFRRECVLYRTEELW